MQFCIMELAEDALWMNRCLVLAGKGLPSAFPNPLVGCVMVREGQVLGEGFHHHAGGPHAEVVAVRQGLLRAGYPIVPEQLLNVGLNEEEKTWARSLFSGATAYVSLEPCAHHGKTPPCALMLADIGIRRVVVATHDPFPEVAGKGLNLLRNAGVEVICPFQPKEAIFQNRAFFTRLLAERPYVILKWAESADGFVDQEDQTHPVQISGPRAKQWLHLWRTQVQGIGIGKSTLLRDRPQLTARWMDGPQPQPFVLSKDPMALPEGWLSFTDIDALLTYGHAQNWSQILIEGGPETHRRWLRSGQWDEIRVFKSQKPLNHGLPAAAIPAQAVLIHDQPLDTDHYYQYLNPHTPWYSFY
jgi:diaminohydroxyphosphoribosylaminopyrimidine deaminase/5-amino-6-(5-phosphoribosylamino)uracil reductase